MTPSGSDRVTDLLPLTPVAFEILLALTQGDRHGYAILQAVEERGRASVQLHAGTLYRALARLTDAGLLEEVADPVSGGDERRRYYRLTSLGRRAATAEARRLESQVGAARSQGLLEGA